MTKKIAHKKYNKIIARTNKYYVDDPQNKCQIGEIVKIQATKPMSKNKRWKLVHKIIEK